MAGPTPKMLADLLPIRRILVDGTVQTKAKQLDFSSDAFDISQVGDVLSVGAGAGVAAETFTRVLTVDKNAIQTMTADALGEVSFALATVGHKPGATKVLYMPANTIDDATKFSFPSYLDKSGSADPVDPASDYVAIVSCVGQSDGQVLRGSFFDLGLRTTAAPTIVSAEIAGGLDKLVIVFSEAMLLADLTGISLTGTSSVPASLYSVSADKQTWTIDLDANIGSASSVSLVIASTRTWRALNGPLVAAGTTSVTTAYDFAATPGATLWMDPPLAADVTTDGGAVTALTTTVGAGQDFTGTGTYRATGMNGKPGIEANGTSDVFNTAGLISALLSASEYYILMAVKVTAPITTDSGTPYLNEAVLSDVAAYGPNITFRLTGTKVQGYQYDGASNKLDEGTISTGVVKVISLRLKSGQMYIGVDGTEGAGVACGNVQATALASTLRLLRGAGGGGSYYKGLLGRTLICNSDPGATIRDAAEAAMVAFYA